MIEDNYGFVYIITNLENGRQYIGKKFFYSKKSKVVKNKTNKGKTKRRFKTESDWRDYFGSSDALKEDVSSKGIGLFSREIIHLCKSKGECSYYEAKEQFEKNVLFSDNYYNSWIQCKIHRTHLIRKPV
jgi:ribosomal protein L35AE/L33A